MSMLVSNASDEASDDLESQGLLVSTPQLVEIISSLLGYPTFATLISEREEHSDKPGLDEAEILVLDHTTAMTKVAALLPALSASTISTVVRSCADAIAECSGVTVFDEVDEFFESYVCRELVMFFENVEGVDPALLRRMGPVEVDQGWTSMETLWDSRSEWVIEGKAEMQEADAASGEPAVLDCVGFLKFRKAGRAGLLADTGGASCALRVTPLINDPL